MSETQEELTLQTKIDRMYFLREDIRRLEATVKGLKEASNVLELEIIDELDSLGTIKSGTTRANVTISEEQLPHVDPEHWQDVWTFLFENEYLEVLRKQLNSTAYRDLRQLGIEVPHTTTVVKRKLNLRSV